MHIKYLAIKLSHAQPEGPFLNFHCSSFKTKRTFDNKPIEQTPTPGQAMQNNSEWHELERNKNNLRYTSNKKVRCIHYFKRSTTNSTSMKWWKINTFLCRNKNNNKLTIKNSAKFTMIWIQISQTFHQRRTNAMPWNAQRTTGETHTVPCFTYDDEIDISFLLFITSYGNSIYHFIIKDWIYPLFG